MQQILIIEDDRALNQGLCKALKTDNSSIQVCSGLYASATDRQIVSCENLKDAKAYDSFQFVRQGFFCVDAKDSTADHLVFNRIVSLKSSFKLPNA
mgnify:CR=1 FL=1